MFIVKIFEESMGKKKGIRRRQLAQGCTAAAEASNDGGGI